ncbi:hypothetical protein [Azospirillum picis]|uniref:Porin n=1 Tax=Azospirillum picis TaxID=488438 RepID=A0ABU0MV34_9PROT|nr:hypothetical protein [Azospirillum picis]MBP2303334.1 hypothetical protein [Azospirillum picis]MDQ0537184.1 hypothetical protein [Azospirillum picis]
MAQDFLTGLPRAPQLVGLPAASKQDGGAKPPVGMLFFLLGVGTWSPPTAGIYEFFGCGQTGLDQQAGSSYGRGGIAGLGIRRLACVTSDQINYDTTSVSRTVTVAGFTATGGTDAYFNGNMNNGTSGTVTGIFTENWSGYDAASIPSSKWWWGLSGVRTVTPFAAVRYFGPT